MKQRWTKYLYLVALWPLAASAQFLPLIPASGTIANCDFRTGDFHFNCFPVYLAYLIKVVFSVLGTLALLMLILAGYEWGTSSLEGGDTSKAKNRIKFAIGGFVFSILSYLIVNTIISAAFGT